jgi:hypothetical protein
LVVAGGIAMLGSCGMIITIGYNGDATDCALLWFNIASTVCGVTPNRAQPLASVRQRS